MYNESYEEYIRSILGYPNYNSNIFENNSHYMPNNFTNMQPNPELEACYPEIYKIVYPMVNKACSEITTPITSDLIDELTNEIYTSVETDNEINLTINLTNEISSSSGNRSGSHNAKTIEKENIRGLIILFV